MEEIDTLKEKGTSTFSEIYNNLLEELSKTFAEKFLVPIPISNVLKNSLRNNFIKSILAANGKINQIYSMNKAVIDFIIKQNFTMLHLELIEFDDAFRMNTLQNRSARLEFACYFDNEKKDKYLLMDVQKEILLTNQVSGNFNFTNEFGNSLQPIFDDYVNEYDPELGNKTSNTKIISIEKTDFTELWKDLNVSVSDTAKIIFYPIIIKERDFLLYQSINRNVSPYKDQFSLFMIGEKISETSIKKISTAYDTFCLTPPHGC